MNTFSDHDDELQATIAEYLAGVLAANERLAFEERLATDGRAQTALAALAPVAATLLSLIPTVTPRAAVRDALLERVGQDLDQSPSSEAGPKQSFTPPFVQLATVASWRDQGHGAKTRVLYIDRRQRRVTMLVRLAAGAKVPAHYHPTAEECFVLEGDLRVGSQVLRDGDYQRSAEGTWHAEQTSENGCTCLIITSLEQLRQS